MSEELAAIMASTTTCKTMSDGSLRISCDIEPRHARAAFNLFGAPGTPVALARITPEAATAEARKEFMPAPEKAKGGVLCKLAAMLCNEPEFHKFLSATMAWAKGYAEPVTAEIAADMIRETCGIGSRAELDHNEAAAEIFHRDFRLPFVKWQQGARP